MTQQIADHVQHGERHGSEELTIIDPSFGLHFFGLSELGHYRELLVLLAWRDVKVRYKQTLIGIGWAILQPLLTMVVFTVVFAHFLHVSSGTQPYAVVVFAGLLPWQLFSQAVTRSTASLVSNGSLISKIYFPRVIIPMASVGAPFFDFVISLGVAAILLAVYGVTPSWGILALPIFALLTLLVSLAAGLWLAALNARFRDIGYVIPFLLQLGMYISPVAYPLSSVPSRWRTLYELNPIEEIIQGFRWGMVGDTAPNFLFLGIGTAMAIIVLFRALSYFALIQQTVADVV